MIITFTQPMTEQEKILVLDRYAGTGIEIQFALDLKEAASLSIQTLLSMPNPVQLRLGLALDPHPSRAEEENESNHDSLDVS